jgi:hypothetical protein
MSALMLKQISLEEKTRILNQTVFNTASDLFIYFDNHDDFDGLTLPFEDIQSVFNAHSGFSLTEISMLSIDHTKLPSLLKDPKKHTQAFAQAIEEYIAEINSKFPQSEIVRMEIKVLESNIEDYTFTIGCSITKL